MIIRLTISRGSSESTRRALLVILVQLNFFVFVDLIVVYHYLQKLGVGLYLYFTSNYVTTLVT